MIKFFRKIRYDLMEKNKTGKYLKYAIGEIILVVIGILIALAINNSNTEKNDRVYELKMLAQVVKAIDEDVKHANIMLERIDILDSTANYFMTLSKNNIAYDNTIFRRIFGLNSGTGFQINSGPYQAIKSSGMDKISNDSLRNVLIDFYDFKLLLYQGNFDHVNRNHQDNIEDLISLLGERTIKSTTDDIFVAYKDIPKDIFQKQEFLQILSDIDWRNNTSRRLFVNTLDDLNLLKSQITLEIIK